MYNLENIHNFRLIGILLDAQRNVSLVLRGKKRKVLVFKNPIRMKINNFQTGNILLEVNIYNDLTEEKDLYRLLCFLYDIEIDELQNEWVQSIINHIHSKSLILVELVESYGAHGVIICKSYSEKA
ncbi:hypothetical protein [Treponema parvum]|uniref:hypothetical protein n=1 Tax=Treponema parvum TaxID=138851 RepID=UPI001AEBC20C|nr:hypothetical protein [Treponema parvum]QTQ15241.1 hypothetical protein HXT04_00145 [Treponema parvum]